MYAAYGTAHDRGAAFCSCFACNGVGQCPAANHLKTAIPRRVPLSLQAVAGSHGFPRTSATLRRQHNPPNSIRHAKSLARKIGPTECPSTCRGCPSADCTRTWRRGGVIAFRRTGGTVELRPTSGYNCPLSSFFLRKHRPRSPSQHLPSLPGRCASALADKKRLNKRRPAKTMRATGINGMPSRPRVLEWTTSSQFAARPKGGIVQIGEARTVSVPRH